jgi:hypothetical protein
VSDATYQEQKVYLLQEQDFDGSATGLYKIGKTKREIQKRTREYKAGNARKLDHFYEIEVEDCQFVETALHRTFAGYRITGEGGGDEWFDFRHVDIDSVIEEYDRYALQTEPEYYEEPQYTRHYSDYEGPNLLYIGMAVAATILIWAYFAIPQKNSGNIRYANQTSIPIPKKITVLAYSNFRAEKDFSEASVICQTQQTSTVVAIPDGEWYKATLCNRFGYIHQSRVSP